MKRLTGKTALVTGASSGIGEACARALAAEGARVIVAARRRDALEALAAKIGEAHAVELDVRDREAVERAVASLPAEWAEIDILVNNAGLGRGIDKLHEGDVDGWEEMIDTNVKGLLYVTRAVVPGMVSRRRGHVVNIGSVAGLEVYPGGNVYCATKHAVDAITKGLRMDVVDTPIRVSTVDPGLVETEFSVVRFAGDVERAKKVYQGLEALTGDDVADAVVYCVTRPLHVSISQVVIMPASQASALVVHRE